jgi:7,8-dihydropterin-6-yl-methyl-4-(beta-D-ribofuranosyl)aminobenzene 5'-phosphate synthase
MLKVQILCNNQTSKSRFLAEHGLSLFIQVDHYRILFDTGQSHVFAHNAKQMGVDLSSVDALVLTHGHYDHTGGVREFARHNRKDKFYLHPAAFSQRFNRGGRENIGIPWGREDFSERIETVREPLALSPNILLTGQVPRFFEITQTPFLMYEGEELVEDYVLDEQLLLIEGRNGVYVFMGCCHMGLGNALRVAAELFPGERIAAVIGGFHLKGSGREASRILQEHQVELIVPLHCTGFGAISGLKAAFGDSCPLLGAGEELIFEEVQ